MTLVRVKREYQPAPPGRLDRPPRLDNFSNGGIPILERKSGGPAQAVKGLIGGEAGRDLPAVEQELRTGADAGDHGPDKQLAVVWFWDRIGADFDLAGCGEEEGAAGHTVAFSSSPQTTRSRPKGTNEGFRTCG
jgi:hypothetical protein